MPAINYKKGYKNVSLKYLPRWPPVNIEFRDLSYSVPDAKGEKTILSGVCGQFQSGEVTAILGPSGAGKSTLLNVLACLNSRTSRTTADVLINGRPRCVRTFRKMSRYILQKDLLQPNLTVHEAMMVSADLKLGNHLTKLQKNEVIEQILDLLRLTKTSQRMCQSLSGGEKKRLSIALELVDNPPVIFLDEPTTGLDDISGSQCISLLRQIALGGRTVVCSIHTPSAKIFEMFDHVYAMTGGQCVYQGNPAQIIPYMQTIGLACPLTYNPADFMEVSCGEYGMEYIDRMVDAVENGKCRKWSLDRVEQNGVDGNFLEDIDPKQLKCRSTSWDQFKVLYNRRWKQMCRESLNINFKFSVSLLIAVLVGLFFQGCGNDATKAIFNFKFSVIVTMLFTYAPLMSALIFFPTEISLLKREHLNRWFKLAPYYWAQLLGTAPVQIGMCLIFLCVAYPLSNQPMEFMRISMYFSTTIMMALVSERFGLLIGSRFKLNNAVFVGPAFIFPLVLLSICGMGNGNAIDVAPFLKFLRNLSFLRFALEGLFEATHGHGRADTLCPETEMVCLFAKATYLKSLLGFDTSSYLVSIVALSSYYLLFAIANYIMIKVRLSLSNPKM